MQSHFYGRLLMVRCKSVLGLRKYVQKKTTAEGHNQLRIGAGGDNWQRTGIADQLILTANQWI